MKIVSCPEANAVFKAPPGFEDEVQELPALQVEVKYPDGTAQREVISRWQFTPAELIEIARTGGVWVSCWGEVLPPMCVHAFQPFQVVKS